MPKDWVNVDNQVFMQLSEHYDNRFAHIELLSIETSFEFGLRSYSFDCIEHDGSSLMLLVNYSLESERLAEVYETPFGESTESIE